MKNILFLLGIIGVCFGLNAQIAPPPKSKKVQVAILFDTSNSMDGLIDQAKSRIWNIVNEVSTLRYEGEVPTFEIALYEYGNDGLEEKDNYIRQVLEFTSDLDDVSQKLFGLTTNGGSEYCGAVIHESVVDLAWSKDATDLKMIYIAGNEAYDQGPIDFNDACKEANEKNVYINTIFCGGYDDGVKLKWLDGANCSQGDYFNIDSDREIEYIETPYDSIIGLYNDSINGTYFGYGNLGMMKKEMQEAEDANAFDMSGAVSTERAIVKSKKSSYKNGSWDLIDAVNDGKDIKDIEEKDLPEEFQNKSDEEKEVMILEINGDRERFQKEIADLAVKRNDFIEAEKKKRAEEGREVDDFGSSVNEAINDKALKNGFSKEK